MKEHILISFFTLFVFGFVVGVSAQDCPPPGYPPISDDCPSAPTVCIDLDGYCDTLNAFAFQQDFPGCPANVLNNDNWFAFIAGSTTINLEIVPSACQFPPGGPQGMQGAVYEGTCNGAVMATQCDCTTGAFNLFNNSFIPGQTYYVVFDGCAGDVCAFEVNVTQGSTLPVPPGPPGPILGLTEVCPGATTDYTLTIPNAATYTWTMSPAGIGSFSSPNPGAPISITWNTAGTVQLCVEASNTCGLTSGQPTCITINSTAIPPTDETYDLCIGDCVDCAGIPFCAATPPNGTPVTLTSYLGCDSVIICHINSINIPPTILGQETFCAPYTYEICGNFYNQSGFYTAVCESYQGCDSTVTVDLAVFDPEAIIAQPVPILDCSANAEVTLDGTGSSFPLVPFAEVFFEWTGPGIVGPNDDLLVNVNAPGQYCLTVTHARDGVECSDTECVTVTQLNLVPQQPTLSGDDAPCEGDVVSYVANAVSTPVPDGFTWTTPNGEPFTQVGPNSINVTWNSTMGGQLCVTADNPCGSSPPECLEITVGANPEDPVLDGLSTACTSNQSETYTVTNVQTGVDYTWTVNNGASFSGSGSSVDVDFSGATGTVDVCVTAGNDCGDTQPTCIAVDVTEVPNTPTLNGPTSVCSNGGGYDFSVDNPQSGVTFNWTAPPPAVITGTGAIVSIDFDGAPSGQVCVSATNACGTSMQACQTVTVIPAPTAEITGTGEFCEGSGGTVDLTITLSGTGPWDVTYTLNGANPTDITINSSPHTLTVSEPGDYELTSLSSGGACDGTVSGTAIVVENPNPTAMLSGSGSICSGSADVAQLTIDLTGEAPWEVCWEVDGASQAPLVIGATPYTLNIGQAQAGDITISCVSDGNDCDGTASGMAIVTVEEAPSVSMIETPCNATNTEYTVSFTVAGGDPGSYEVIPSTGTWNGNIFTSTPIPTGSGYSFGVTDGNACDTIDVSEPQVICDCTTAAGTTDLDPIDECGDGPVTVPFNSMGQNLDGDDIPVFVLHSGSGASIVAPIIGQYALPTVSFVPGVMTYGQTYYLSAVVGNNDGSNNVDLTDPCLAVSQGTPVTFFEIPTAALTGSPAICEGDDASLTVNFTGEGPWSITYDDGNDPQTLNGITDNPYTLVVSPAVTTDICLTDMSDSNCPGNASGCSNVVVNTGVSYANLMTTCNSTATAYVITFDASGGDPASYFVTGVNGTFLNGVFTSEEIPTGTGFSLTFDDANACDPQDISQGIVVCDCETDAGVMMLDTISLCGNGPIDAGEANGMSLDGDDILVYYLHTGASNTLGTVVATNNLPAFSFDGGSMSYGTVYYVSSVAGNDDGTGLVDLADPCLSVAPGTPIVFYEVPTAAISGGIEICPGETADLTIDLTGDSPWAVTINGTVVDNINGTPYTYQVQPAATTTYDLTLVEDENCVNIVADAQTVTVHDPPVIDSVGVECNQTGTAYTVALGISGGDATCYEVIPPTGTLTGDQFVSDEIPSGQGYTFEVTDCFGCPADAISAPTVSCDCISEAGDMLFENLSICGSDIAGANYQGGEVLDADDVLCFMIHSGNNVAIATNPDAPEFSYLPGQMNYGQTYFICAVVGNDNGNGCFAPGDPCLSIGACAEVVFNDVPTAALSGDANICEGEQSDLTIELTGVGPWEVTYSEAGGSDVTVTANSSPFTIPVTPSGSTVYQLVSLADANCDGTVSGVATVNVNEPPQAVNTTIECDPSATFYTVTFDIVGGDAASYAVNPAGSGTLTVNSFESAQITSGNPFVFEVDDINGCGPFIVDGIFACDCNTEAGTMSPQLIELCADEIPAINPTTGQVLDPDDVLVYVLHTNAGNTLGVIIAEADNPNFTFDPGTMMTGTAYYISAVAGNNNGSGSFDPNDPCLSVAPGTPVVFNDVPTISISGTTSICEGDEATVSLSMTGAAPFTVTFDQGGTQQTIPGLPNDFNITEQFPATTTITLISVEDANGCSATSSDFATITVNPTVSAGEVLDDYQFCENDPTTFNLFDQLSGADPGGTWTSPSGQTVPGGTVIIASLSPGTYPYVYTVTAIPPCEDDEAIVTVIVDEGPVADAGEDGHLDCDVTEVTLGGANTTPGLSYTWVETISGDTVGNSSSIVVTTSGVFELVVSSDFGCSASDIAEVEQFITDPQPHYSAIDVSCFGDTDGVLLIDSITGGLPPYLCSFNGGPFTQDKQFVGLSPGNYEIVIEDFANCQTTFEFEILEPAEVTVQIDGSFATDDPVIELGESVELSIISTPPAVELDTIIWSSGGLDSCANCSRIEVAPTQQTIYSVYVDENGCSAEDMLTVVVSKSRDVYIPNAFSPNDDGPNDIFRIYAGKNVTRVNSLLIFNRWGELMYEYYKFDPNDPLLGWDGRHRGEPQNPQVFTYFAEIEFVDGSVELFEGSVTLLK